MPEGLEDADVAVETHSLLLSLAGLIDDELLGWCRELVAVGDSDYALELVVAAVQADRIRLPGPLHADLIGAALRRRVLSRSEAFPSPDSTPRMQHRFASDPAEQGFGARIAARSPETALLSVPARLLRDCQLWLTWRVTPAGGAPGPLPHPVVLIETLDGIGAEVLAYQVAEVLSRAGVFASVEVFTSEMELSDYHRAALAKSHSVFEPEHHEGSGAAERQPLGGAEPADLTVPTQTPSPTPRARVEPPVNGSGPSGRAAENNGMRSAPASGSDGARRSPMHPVDRVITARSSAPRRPRPDRQPGTLDDVASGLNFERGAGGFDVEREQSVAEPEPVRDDELPPERPQPERRAPERPRNDSMWSNSREVGMPPRDSAREDQPPPHPGPSPVAERGPVDRGPADRPPRPNPGPKAAPKRPVARPGDGASDEPAADLSDVEQRLLRQLHEELAAREDRGMPMLPENGQPPSRMFRGANGSRKRPPRTGPEHP